MNFDNYEWYCLPYTKKKDFYFKKSRLSDRPQFIRSIATALQKIDGLERRWNTFVWKPFLEVLKKKAENGKLILHVKPTHDYTGDQSAWWEYTYSEDDRYGWGYSFKWIDEPSEKLNHKFGEMLYRYDRYQRRRFNQKQFWLTELLKRELERYIYSLYDYAWLNKNASSGKIVKIQVLGLDYWYRIVYNKHGVACWENFIWQSNDITTVKL
jgi:hypothetical protein